MVAAPQRSTISAQGWPRILRSTLEGVDDAINPEKGCVRIQPFRVDIEWNLLPRIERQTTPLNPGLSLRRGPYDCAIWHVQKKRDKITWNLGFETWREPVGRLEGFEPQIPRAPEHARPAQSEGIHDQQHELCTLEQTAS